MDMRNYAAMIALHLAEMAALKSEDCETYLHLQSGAWAPNKNGLPFCSLGADEALEQENKKMKMTGGLVGITQLPETLNKFFLVAPYLSKVDAYVQNTSPEQIHDSQHHELRRTGVSLRQLKNANLLVKSLRDFTNPFQYEGIDLVNLVANRVISKDV